MKQDKNERLVIRITPSLKKKIEELAQKQNITASELVRKVLEDTVCKKDKEIEQHVLMVNTIGNYINTLLGELVFAASSEDINRMTKELRHYRKLSYSHQSSAIELILSETSYHDTKVQSLKNLSEDALKALNGYIEKSSQYSENDKIFENIQDRIGILEESVWDSTFKLYNHLCDLYFNK